MRPYLLLDVDGPLNPDRATTPPPGYEAHHLREGDKTWDVLMNPGHGELITALAEVYDPIWATGWEHGANRLLAPRIGLPEFPVITWPEGAIGAGSGSLCWKTRHVAQWVDRPFAWIDDEISDADTAYLEAQGVPAHYLHLVDSAIGLTAEDCATVREWAARLG
ncbi:hypothetical protein FB561_7246 [Kribbella amoyensis]|uniref:Secreted protein n=1 Tax=Kribbella amoyensis TaxID=996641 RepID=A0A561B3D0_9ACTN|nr:hypothetical protein [Kribbella amoyensis]TWD73357.1 hypothetical protein FB561_7246 [Kribbella amoyensis]